MSKTNVQLFFEKAQSDQDLQNKLKTLMAAHSEQNLDNLVKLASESGFPFTKDDLLQTVNEAIARMQQDAELDDEQLAMVAGGRGDPGAWVFGSIMIVGCIMTWILNCSPKAENCSVFLLSS